MLQSLSQFATQHETNSNKHRRVLRAVDLGSLTTCTSSVKPLNLLSFFCKIVATNDAHFTEWCEN